MSVVTPVSRDIRGSSAATPRWRWNVEQYHKLIVLGILTEDDPVELIDGQILVKSDCRNNYDGGLDDDLDWRWTVEQYHTMIDAGILTENDPVELLDGELVLKMPKNPAHETARRMFRKALDRLVSKSPNWFVDDQSPLSIGRSEPEPDLAVIGGDIGAFRSRHPTAAELAFVVEISDSTIRDDRDQKKQLYARALIPVYWIVNLKERQVEVYTEPTGPCDVPDYRQLKVFGSNDELPVVIDGREVGRLNVGELLP